MIGTLVSGLLTALGKSTIARGLLGSLTKFFDHGLLIMLVLVAAVSVVQTLRLQNKTSALKNCEVASAVASAHDAVRYADNLLLESSDYVQRQQENAPVVERVVERTRNVCLRAESRVPGPVPTAASFGGPTSSEIKNGREHEEWLALVAEDLRTCQVELDRLDFIRKLHNGAVTP